MYTDTKDDDGRLCRGDRSPWYMIQCVVYGHGFRYVSKIRV
jgi:hypothetical protein